MLFLIYYFRKITKKHICYCKNSKDQLYITKIKDVVKRKDFLVVKNVSTLDPKRRVNNVKNWEVITYAKNYVLENNTEFDKKLVDRLRKYKQVVEDTGKKINDKQVVEDTGKKINNKQVEKQTNKKQGKHIEKQIEEQTDNKTNKKQLEEQTNDKQVEEHTEKKTNDKQVVLKTMLKSGVKTMLKSGVKNYVKK